MKRVVFVLLILFAGISIIQECVYSEDVPMEKVKTATFAGGCFWCMEPPFEKLDGVISVTSGYCGGTESDPTYEAVSSGKTGYAEAVQVVFDPGKINYTKLLDVFWMNVDPTQVDGQFADHGKQYRTAIFYHDEEQKQLAGQSKENLEQSSRFKEPIVTSVEAVGPFYAAEDYHQDYYKKNPIHYKLYRIGSGRDSFLKKTWWDK